jgi:hypothetical protein
MLVLSYRYSLQLVSDAPEMTHYFEPQVRPPQRLLFIAYIKVDKQKIPEPFRGLELNSGRSLVILARDPANSKDTQVMREIALKDQRFIKRK